MKRFLIRKITATTMAGMIVIASITLFMPIKAHAELYGSFRYSTNGSTAAITGYTGTTDTEIDIPSTINGYTVTEIGRGAFCPHTNSKCETVTKITIPSTVTTVDSNAMSNCRNLTSVVIPEGVTYIGQDAFACSAITHFDLPASLRRIDLQAFNCEYCTSIDVSADNQQFCSDKGVLYDKGMKTIYQFPCSYQQDYTIPVGVTTIRKNAMYMILSIKHSITVPVTLCNSFNNFEKFLDFKAVYCSKNSAVDKAMTAARNASESAGKDNRHYIADPSFGKVKYSTTKKTKKPVTVTVQVKDATVKTMSHKFTKNGSYIFKATNILGASKTTIVWVHNIKK